MAKMRAGSTVGGKQIVTLDVMNDVVNQITSVEIDSKMKKAESEVITNFSTTNSYIKEKDKNGFWQVNTGDNDTNTGLIANLSTDNARFQLHASHNSTDGTLKYRVGWNDNIKQWRELITDNSLNRALSTKLDVTGGTLRGPLDATGYLSSNSYLRAMNGSSYIKVSTNGSEALYETTATRHNFNKPLAVADQMTVNGYPVYHAGTFNYNDFSKKLTESTTIKDLNSMNQSGKFYGSFTSNTPISNELCYLEVDRNGAGDVMIQKLFSNSGKAYYRLKSSGTWSKWFTIGGNLTFSKEITESNWTKNTDLSMYELNVTHNLDTNTITSVIVTDENNVSMFTGFKVLSTTTLKIYCVSPVNGKVVINANQQ